MNHYEYLVLVYLSNISLATVARGLIYVENHIISVVTSDFVAQTQVKLAYM